MISELALFLSGAIVFYALTLLLGGNIYDRQTIEWIKKDQDDSKEWASTLSDRLHEAYRKSDRLVRTNEILSRKLHNIKQELRK